MWKIKLIGVLGELSHYLQVGQEYNVELERSSNLVHLSYTNPAGDTQKWEIFEPAFKKAIKITPKRSVMEKSGYEIWKHEYFSGSVEYTYLIPEELIAKIPPRRIHGVHNKVLVSSSLKKLMLRIKSLHHRKEAKKEIVHRLTLVRKLSKRLEELTFDIPYLHSVTSIYWNAKALKNQIRNIDRMCRSIRKLMPVAEEAQRLIKFLDFSSYTLGEVDGRTVGKLQVEEKLSKKHVINVKHPQSSGAITWLKNINRESTLPDVLHSFIRDAQSLRGECKTALQFLSEEVEYDRR